MCEKWCMQFIDAGRLPVNNKPFWITNNYIERINRTIKTIYSSKQTVLTFVKCLYGMSLVCEKIISLSSIISHMVLMLHLVFLTMKTTCCIQKSFNKLKGP